MLCGVTRYVALVEELEEAVAAGDLAPGAVLPSVRSFARERGMAPATVARAYQTLEILSPTARLQLYPLLRTLVADVDAAGHMTMRTVGRAWYQENPARSELVRAFVGARLLVEDVDHARRPGYAQGIDVRGAVLGIVESRFDGDRPAVVSPLDPAGEWQLGGRIDAE